MRGTFATKLLPFANKEARNISVIKLMFMEDDDVSWCKELYQCIWKFYMEIEELQYISKNQSVKKIL